MKRFKIKEFAKWHKETYGPGIFEGDVWEYYATVLKQNISYISKSRFESIVCRTMELNNY